MRVQRTGAALAAVFTWATCVAATAQTSTTPLRLSLDEAIRLAAERNPRLWAAREQLSIAESDVRTAGQRPNPVFELSSEGLGGPAGLGRSGLFDRQELLLRVDHTLETGGRRRWRTEAAGHQMEAARAEARDQARLLRLDVQRTYSQLVLARAEVEATQASLEEIDKVLALNRIRLDQGEISGGEYRRLEVERLRFVDETLSAELAARSVRSALLALIGETRLDLPVEPTDTLDHCQTLQPAAGEPGALRAAALAARADVEAARQERARAESGVRLQQALRLPSVTAGLGYHRDFGEGGLAFGVSVPIPVFDRNRGEIARAHAEQRLADHRLSAIETAVALEVQQAFDRLETSRRRVEYIEREYLRSARQSRDIVLAAYRAGAADLVDYLDAQRAYREAQRTRNRALYDCRVNQFELDAATGGGAPPSGVPAARIDGGSR